MSCWLFFFFHHTFRSEFSCCSFSPRCLLFTNTCRSRRNGAKMWKTSWYILVIPCSNHTAVIELPPNSSARSYYPPGKMEIESTQIGSALLLMLSRHRIIPQRIGYERKAFFLFFQSSAFLSTVVSSCGAPDGSVVFIQRNLSFFFPLRVFIVFVR